MKVVKSDSGSDVSSDSSWTVIEEIQETFITDTGDNTKLNQNSGIEVIKTTEVLTISDASNDKDNDFVNVTLSKDSIKQSSDEESESSNQENKENGFLTFDEYLQERMLEHDYEYPNKSMFKKKLGKSRKFSKNRCKCKAETIGVLSLCASLLTVTGIGLFCLIFPENIDPKNFDTVKSNCQAIANNGSMDYNSIVASFNRTMEVLQAANNSKILPKSADSVMRNVEYSPKHFKRTIGPMKEIAASRLRLNRKRKNSFSASNLFKNDVCYPTSNNGVCYAHEDPRLTTNPTKKQRNKAFELTKLIEETNNKLNSTRNGNKSTALTTIESVLASTNLKKIIRSIIHDICILKLITYLNKNKEQQETTKKKSSKGEQKASKRKLFEAIAEGMEIISQDDNKDRRIKTAKRKIKSKKQIVKNKERQLSTSLSLTPPPTRGTVRYNTFKFRPCSSSPLKTELVPKFENGKSECERRFEELDDHRKKSLEVCSKHKINIQQIKQQYRNEIDAIKDSNIEPMVRLQRIQTLREKYRLQLKKNRENYIKEMSKMKRMRVKMLKDLCTQKKTDSETKDVAVGSYVVPIDHDFYRRLQQLKENEVKPFVFNGNIEPLFKISTPSKNDHEVCKFHFPILEKKVDTLKLSQIEDCTQIKKQCLVETSPSVLSFSIDGAKQTESNLDELDESSDDNMYQIEQKECENQVKISDDHENVGPMRRKKLHLYRLAFERRAPIIENLDNVKWRQKKAEYWGRYKKESSKQDPEKCYKPNVMLFKTGRL